MVILLGLWFLSNQPRSGSNPMMVIYLKTSQRRRNLSSLSKPRRWITQKSWTSKRLSIMQSCYTKALNCRQICSKFLILQDSGPTNFGLRLQLSNSFIRRMVAFQYLELFLIWQPQLKCILLCKKFIMIRLKLIWKNANNSWRKWILSLILLMSVTRHLRFAAKMPNGCK